MEGLRIDDLLKGQATYMFNWFSNTGLLEGVKWAFIMRDCKQNVEKCGFIRCPF